MRRPLIMVLVVVALFSVVLTACKKEEKEEKDINIEELSESLLYNLEFQDEMILIEEQMFRRLYGMETDKLEEYIAYSSGGATADEIVLVKVKDDEDVEGVKQALKERIEDQKENFVSYVPEEMKKLENPILKTYGKYIILCIHNDYEQAEELISK